MHKKTQRVISGILASLLVLGSMSVIALNFAVTASAMEVTLDFNDVSIEEVSDENVKDDESAKEDEEKDDIYSEVYRSGIDVYEVEIKEEEIDADDIKVLIKDYTDENGRYISTYKEIEFPDGVGPLIVDDRTLLPIRGIAETIGFDVDFRPNTQVIDISKDVNDWDWDSGKLPTQCENMLNIMKDRASDNPNRSEELSIPYLYFNRVSLTMDGVDALRERIINAHSAKYGVSLALGSNSGVSYVGKVDKFGADSGRLNYTMDISARLYKERTMIPLRAVGEMLGFNVEWDGVSRTVRLNGNK